MFKIKVDFKNGKFLEFEYREVIFSQKQLREWLRVIISHVEYEFFPAFNLLKQEEQLKYGKDFESGARAYYEEKERLGWINPLKK